MASVEQVTNSATASVQGLIAGDAKITMAGKEPKEMKEQAATILNAALPQVSGCVEAIAKDPKQLEQNDPDVLGVQAVSLAAFGTAIGSTSSKK